MKFLDQAKIYLQSGNGGAGCVSFRREKYIEFGGPDGGNGGRGGDVIFRVTKNVNTLIDFRYKQHFRAESGKGGSGQNRSGQDGADCIIVVPAGTQILDENKEEVLADLMEDGQELTILKGGDKGHGNTHYKSSTNQAPRRSTPGWPGQELPVWLRLKLIADIGLVGLPNAGKSTFLSACSNARPKIADYPFTTLHPNLGVVLAGDREFVVADIPGLISGAHEGKGLGDRFLGHVERTRALLHLVDMTSENPAEDYKTIRQELSKYGSGLCEKQEVVALTKSDSLTSDIIKEKLNSFEEKVGITPLVISSISREGISDMVYTLLGKIDGLCDEDL